MATFCQFCDKEMMFEGQATIVEGYITCGAPACQAKAKVSAKEIVVEQQIEDTKKARVCIFATLDYTDADSWKLIPEDKHPELLRNHGMMGHLLSGGIITIECEDGEVSFRAKTAKEVTNDIMKNLQSAK